MDASHIAVNNKISVVIPVYNGAEYVAQAAFFITQKTRCVSTARTLARLKQ